MSQEWEYCVIKHTRGYLTSVEYAGGGTIDGRSLGRMVPLGEVMAFMDQAGWQFVSTIDGSAGQISDFKRRIISGRSVNDPPFLGGKR